MTTQQLREKIGAWLSDKTNHEGDLVDFLVDECGVVLKEDEEVEEYGAKILCNDCDYYISSEDFDAGNGRTMIDTLDNGEYRCEVCNEKKLDNNECVE